MRLYIWAIIIALAAIIIYFVVAKWKKASSSGTSGTGSNTGSTINIGNGPYQTNIALQTYSFYGDGSLELRGVPTPAVADPALLVGRTVVIDIQGLGTTVSKVAELVPSAKLGPNQIGLVVAPGAYTTQPMLGLKSAAAGDVALIS
jgi:hypothetical protein